MVISNLHTDINMDIAGQIKKKFAGLSNAIVLILILIACVRFSGAEWQAPEYDLGVRLLRAFYIVLGVIALGFLMAAARLIIARFDSPAFWKNRADEIAVSAFKTGLIIGGIIVFAAGVLLVKDYLGPFEKVIEILMEKLSVYLPG